MVSKVDMPRLDQVGKELEEERHQQQLMWHAIHVGICSDDHFVIAQAIHAILDVEGMLQKIKFFVLVNDFLGQPEAVEWFTPQAENGLCFNVP